MPRTVKITNITRPNDTYYVDGQVDGNPYRVTVAKQELDDIVGQENKIMYVVNKLGQADTRRRAAQFGNLLVTRTIDP